MKRAISGFLILMLGLTLAGCSSSSGGEDTGDIDTPMTATEVAEKRTAVLNYLSNLSYSDDFEGAISGQNAYHGSQLSDFGYHEMVEDLHTETGEWVGILGIDYEFERLYSPTELSQANKVLIAYSKANGIVQVTMAPQNPWGNDESDLESNPGAADDPASGPRIQIASGAGLDDLIDPTKTVNAAWMRKLNRIGTALQELRDAGVIVLFRPIQEMNGNWFWWGMASHPDDASSYVRVYQHMRDYFTDELKLNNLIWLYSPASSYGDAANNTADWIRTVDWAYPGDAYVDIVAGTSYTDGMDIVDYETYLSLEKPLGMAEYSPRDINNASEIANVWDNSKIITRLRDSYPRIGFWVSWHYFWSLISNENSTELLQNDLVINRDDFDWSVTQPLLPVPVYTAPDSTDPAISGTMNLRGSMNSWASTAMIGHIVSGDTVWTVTVPLAAATAYTFKFDANGDWTDDYGAGVTAGTAVAAGGNITYTSTTAGNYIFTFNKTDLTWSVSL
jgi:mannan endo-1,4-beta-mannosidase